MGEGMKSKVAKAFRHQSDKVFEREFKSRNLFSDRPEVRRTRYRFRVTDPAAEIIPGQSVQIVEDGNPHLGVWIGCRRIGEVDEPGTQSLRRAFQSEPAAGSTVEVTVREQPGLSGFASAGMETTS